MVDLTNFEIYKIVGIGEEEYIFSVTEENEDEQSFQYYMLTFTSNRKPIITILNNTIEILSTKDLELVPVDLESPELITFANLIKNNITQPPTLSNPILKRIINNSNNFIKAQ